MRRAFLLGLLVTAIAAVGSTPAAAQSGRSVGGVIRDAVLGRTGQNVPQNDPRYESRYPYDPRYETGRYETGKVKNKAKGGGGPPFCRNGQGHPTKGWQWCEDKGWAGAGRPVLSRQRDVILGNPAPRQRGRVEQQPTIGGVLGDIILGRRGN
jgi:hypothetical protein